MPQPTPVPLFRILITPTQPSGRPCAPEHTDAAETQQRKLKQQQQQLLDWSCQQAALIPPLVGLLHSYTHLCDVRLPGTGWYRCLTGQQPDKAERDDPAAHSPPQPLHTDAEEWQSHLVRDLDSLLPHVSLCLPREGEPQHCMLVRGHGGGGHSAGPERQQQGQQQGQERGQEGQGQGQGQQDVDAEALRAVELGATLLRLRAVARAAGAAEMAAKRLQLLAGGVTGGPGWPSFPAEHGEPPELRFALASVGVLAAASGALLALRNALGSGRLDPAHPSGLHHTTAQEVSDGLLGELRQWRAAAAVSGLVAAAREAAKAAPGCPYAEGEWDAASSDSSSSRCSLGVDNWCLRHSPSYLLLLSRASRFAHDMVSPAACGGGGGGGIVGSSSNRGSSTTPLGDDVGAFLHSFRLHSLLNSLASAILEVPPPPPPQRSSPLKRPVHAGAGAGGVHAVPPLHLPDDPDHNMPPHVATCLTVSICHVASCCCMLASSEVLGKDVLHADAMEGEDRATGSDCDCSLPSVVMRALTIGPQTLEFLRKLQHQATKDALGEGQQWGHTAQMGANGGGGPGSSSSSTGSSGWAALDALRLQKRLGVWLGGRGLTVLQTGLGEVGGQEGQGMRALHGLPAVSGSASAHAGAVRAVTHLLLAAPYLMVWAFLSQRCVSVTVNMAFLASVQLRKALKDCSSALRATWRLHTSHPQLRLPLPGEPQVPPPAAASTANPQAAAAAGAAAADSGVVGPLTLTYIAHLAIPLSTGNRWLTMLNVQDAERGWEVQEEQRMGLRLARVEMLAWALAGATVAGEAWLRLAVQWNEQGQGAQRQARDGIGARREEGQGERASSAGAILSQLLLDQVGQLVGRVRRAVFDGPDAAVKVPHGHHAHVARCLAGCRLLRSFDHVIRLLASTQWAIATTDVLAELYAVPYYAINLWEEVLKCSSHSAGLSSFGRRVDGGGGQLPLEAAEVQVAAAKELCGLLVSHAKLLRLHKARAQDAAPRFYSAVTECRAAREALVAGGQGLGGSRSREAHEQQAWVGSGDSHDTAASAGMGSCEGTGGCGAGGAEEVVERTSGTDGSSGGGLGLLHGAAPEGAAPEGAAAEASSSAGSSGDGQRAALELRCAVAVERALYAHALLQGEVVNLASVLSFFVATPNLDWQISILAGKGPHTASSSSSPQHVQPCGSAASRNPAAAPSSLSRSSPAITVDPAAFHLLRGAVAHHAAALYGAVMAHFTLCQALCDVAFGPELDPPPGVRRPDDLEVMLNGVRCTCVGARNYVVRWALRAPALLLPVLTRGSTAACRVPRADAKYASVRMVLVGCSEVAVRVGRSWTGDGEWGAAPGWGGEGARWADEGARGHFRGATRAEMELELRSGCCAVLDCVLRLAAREDTAEELVAWAQEGVGRGGAAGLPAEGKAATTRQGDGARVSACGAAEQGNVQTVNGRVGPDDAVQRRLAEAVGMLQGALASLGLPHEAELAARLGAAAAAAGAAAAVAGSAEAAVAAAGAAVAAGGASEGASGGSGGACGVEQQQQHQQQQRKCKRIVDAFRRQARELLASYSALPSYPYTALGLHTPSSGSSSPGVQLGRGGRSKKCGKGSSKGGGGGGAQRQEADEAPLPVTVLPRVCSNPLCASFEGSCEEDLWLRKCGGCLAVRYCSRGCQAAHWGAGHREECRALRDAGVE